MWAISSLPASSVFNRFSQIVAGFIGRNRSGHGIAPCLFKNRFMRFLLAGGVNTLFGFAAYSLAIIAGAEVWLALLIGMLLGTVFNFFTTGGFVFREILPARFPRFVLCYLLVYVINLQLIELIFIYSNNKILSQAILVFPMAILSYFLMARMVFPPK